MGRFERKSPSGSSRCPWQGLEMRGWHGRLCRVHKHRVGAPGEHGTGSGCRATCPELVGEVTAPYLHLQLIGNCRLSGVELAGTGAGARPGAGGSGCCALGCVPFSSWKPYPGGVWGFGMCTWVPRGAKTKGSHQQAEPFGTPTPLLAGGMSFLAFQKQTRAKRAKDPSAESEGPRQGAG